MPPWRHRRRPRARPVLRPRRSRLALLPHMLPLPQPLLRPSRRRPPRPSRRRLPRARLAPSPMPSRLRRRRAPTRSSRPLLRRPVRPRASRRRPSPGGQRLLSSGRRGASPRRAGTAHGRPTGPGRREEETASVWRPVRRRGVRASARRSSAISPSARPEPSPERRRSPVGQWRARPPPPSPVRAPVRAESGTATGPTGRTARMLGGVRPARRSRGSRARPGRTVVGR